jgi:hypothetical protein
MILTGNGERKKGSFSIAVSSELGLKENVLRTGLTA